MYDYFVSFFVLVRIIYIIRNKYYLYPTCFETGNYCYVKRIDIVFI